MVVRVVRSDEMATEPTQEREGGPARGDLEAYVDRALFGDSVDSLDAHVRRKRALADATRYGLLYLLYERERLPRKELAEASGLDANGLQHHLRELLDANLVAEAPTPDGADGRLSYYRITALGKDEIEADLRNVEGAE